MHSQNVLPVKKCVLYREVAFLERVSFKRGTTVFIIIVIYVIGIFILIF